MTRSGGLRLALAFASIALLLAALPPVASFAQEQSAAADATEDASAPKPLSEDELEVLVARIALYPDELVALVSGASLYPLQIVEAARFLEQYQKDKSLKPKDGWDGSVVSLLNYPEIVKMMSDDLDWTQAFGNAIAYQQKEVLVAIQQLRDEAVAKGIIKSDDKVQVREENENVVIRPADPEKVYVPRYEPEMLYVEDYAAAPISYYPEPYPYYWYPGATFFAGAITGAFWGAVVDWDDWGVWGGDWDGGDIDIDCNHCFNDRDFNGKIDFDDVDWSNIDRDKINIDRDQFNKFDRTELKNRVKQKGDNALRDRAKDIKRAETRNRPGNKAGGTKDVRKSVQDGLKAQGGAKARPASDKRPAASKPANRKAAAKRDNQRPQASRKGGKPKPAQRADNRPKKSSGLGNPQRGKATKISSNRGHKSMGGGQRGGPRKVHGGRGGGGRAGRGGGGRRR